MKLWNLWYSCVQDLQASCSRKRTFLYLVLVLLGFSTRWDNAGVTSFIRAVSLEPMLYRGRLHFFNYSEGLNLELLARLWIQLVHRMLPALQVGEYTVYVADGLKAAKEGRKMPAVKKLHQSSANNSKAAYIMGHSFQAIALLVRTAGGQVAAVPLAARIHEGLIWFPGDRRSLLDKLVLLFQETMSAVDRKAMLVVDAYYASRKVIEPLLREGHQLLTRVRSNAVGYQPVSSPKVKKRGRPKKYGKKVALPSYFAQTTEFIQALSPVYGESRTLIQYRTEDLLWRPFGRVVRFVWVIHPTRGKLILMCTDISMDPLKIMEMYGYRFKIEVSFRHTVHGMGTYAYHFWMQAMKPLRQNEGNQYLHKKEEAYRKAVKRKMEAYHRYVQLGCIAQGLLQYLALQHGQEVWSNFRSWLRTMKTDQPPSELVVSYALRSSLFDFLVNAPEDHKLKKIIAENMTVQQLQDYQHAA